MKLINPILLTLNNTLHIKADNLEPVEVDSSCVDYLTYLAFKDIKWYIHGITNPKYYLHKGINISELADRIQIVRDVNCPVGSPKAFLLPEKEDKELLEDLDKSIIEPYAQFKCNKRTYTIEEIQREVNRVKELFRTNVDAYGKPKSIIKTLDSIINNLKK